MIQHRVKQFIITKHHHYEIKKNTYKCTCLALKRSQHDFDLKKLQICFKRIILIHSYQFANIYYRPNL